MLWNHGAFSFSNSVLFTDRQNEQRNSVDTMYNLLNELVKQIATATEGNYQNSSILFKLPKQPKNTAVSVNKIGKNFVKRCRLKNLRKSLSSPKYDGYVEAFLV